MAKKYQKVYERLKADLYTRYPVGTLLPTESELMQLYGASRTTVRHAVALLKAERLVDVRQGRGTQVLIEGQTITGRARPGFFHNVTGVIEQLVTGEERQPFEIRGGIIDTIPAPASIAGQLQVEPGTMIYRLERILCAQQTPAAYVKNYYRCDLIPGFERFSGDLEALKNVYWLLENEYHVYFFSGQEYISAQLSGFFDSGLLELKPGTPLLVFRRTAYTADMKTLEYCERLARPDMIQLVVSMSGAPHYEAGCFRRGGACV